VPQSVTSLLSSGESDVIGGVVTVKLKVTLELVPMCNESGKSPVPTEYGFSSLESTDFTSKISIIRQELAALEESERLLDEHEALVLMTLRDTIEHAGNAQLAYCGWDDMVKRGGFDSESVVMISGPVGTQLAIPEAQYNPDSKSSKYSIYACSSSGPIDAYLITTSRSKRQAADEAYVPVNMVAPMLMPLEPSPGNGDVIMTFKEASRDSAMYTTLSGAPSTANAGPPAAKRARQGTSDSLQS